MRNLPANIPSHMGKAHMFASGFGVYKAVAKKLFFCLDSTGEVGSFNPLKNCLVYTGKPQ